MDSEGKQEVINNGTMQGMPFPVFFSQTAKEICCIVFLQRTKLNEARKF
jgi:hypothetical protein